VQRTDQKRGESAECTGQVGRGLFQEGEKYFSFLGSSADKDRRLFVKEGAGGESVSGIRGEVFITRA